jgi:hypothetical protein
VRYIIIILLLVSGIGVLAQDPNFPLQQQFDPDVEALVSQARQQMANNDYEGANITFRKALATKKVLPSSMSYFFAKTLFVIHQNQNAKNFVKKYIELAGQGGDYYDEAVSLLKLIEDEFKAIEECDLCNLSGYRYATCENCNGLGQTVEVCHKCYGNSPIMCPKCIGRGVVITMNSFGEKIYSSCDQCGSKGYINCPVCQGEKEIAGRCSVCLGTGKKVSKLICTHQAE